MSVLEQLQTKRKEFNAVLATQIVEAQGNCQHTRVAHWDGFSEYSTLHPIRICMECGLEEEGGWWCYSLDCSHWHPKGGFDKPRLGPKDGRTFVKKSFDEVMRLRP